MSLATAPVVVAKSSSAPIVVKRMREVIARGDGAASYVFATEREGDGRREEGGVVLGWVLCCLVVDQSRSTVVVARAKGREFGWIEALT